MKTGPLVSLGLSVVLGAGAVLVGRGYMAGNAADASIEGAQSQAVQAIAMQNVVLAKQDIEPGTALTADMFKTVEWPASAVISGMLTELPSEDEQFYARGMMVSGEPVLMAKLEEEGYRMTLSAEISPGKRAIAIIVNNDTGVAGFVLPGDRVDVNAFLPVSGDAIRENRGPDAVRVGEDMYARPVLKNVTVLAVDQTFDSNLEGARPSSTVTLEVTPAEALVLGAAGQSGKLGLTLIGQKEKGEEMAQVSLTPKPKRVRRTNTVRSRKPRKTTVRVINGNDETKVSAPVVTRDKQEGAK